MTTYGEYIRKVIVWGLAAYIFFISILFTTRTENTVVIKAVLSQTIIFGLGLLWFARMIEEKRFVFRPAGFNLPLLALLWGCIVSTVLSPFVYYSIEELARFLAYFVSVWLIYNNVKSRFDFNVLLWALVAGTAYSIIYAIMQRTGLDPIEWGQTVFLSTFGNANFFSAFLMSALPASLGLLFAIRSWYGRFGLGLMYLLGVYCLLFAKTRSSWLGYLGSVVLLGVCYFFVTGALRYLRSHLHHVAAAIIIFLILLIGLIVFMMNSEFAYWDEFTSIFKVSYGIEGGTNQVRLVMWMGSLKMWAEHPFLGQGLGTFQLAFPRFRPSYYHLWGVSHNTRHAHNEYLEVVAEQGILGNILFGWWWVVVFWLAGRGIRNATLPYWRHILIGLLCGWTAHMIDNVASPHLRWAGTAVAAYFVVGLIFAAIALARAEAAAAGAPRKFKALPATLNDSPFKPVIYLIFLVLFGAVAWQEWKIFAGDMELKLAESYLRQAGDRATPATRNYWDAAFEHFREAVRLNRWDHSALYKSAFINLQSGRIDAAMQDYRDLTAIAPNYAQVHYNLGLAHQTLGRPFDALREFLLATRIEDKADNHKLVEGFLKQPPINDPERAFSYQGRLAKLAIDEWITDFHNYLYWTRYKDPQAPGMEPVTRFVDRGKYSYAFSSRARTWHSLGDRRKRGYYFNRALLWNPHDYEVLWQQQEEFAAQGNLEAMGQVISTIISNVSPQEVQLDRRVAEIVRMAVERLGQHADANAKNDRYWDLLGLGLMKTYEFQKALGCFTKALEINPQNPMAQQHQQEIRQVIAYFEQQQRARPATAPEPLKPLPGRAEPQIDDRGQQPQSGGFVR